jgi:transcriptional regulator with XRE-family HTH domain
MPRPGGVDHDLARVLRGVREGRGVSQEAVARDAGLTVGAYARIERGETNPSWTTVRNVARALDVSLAELARTLEKEDG